jgi:phosphatidylinositol alpha-1,6-mannosyltransferase
MKILIVTNSLSEMNGVSRYSAGLVDALLAEGHEIECLVHTVAVEHSVTQYNVLEGALRYIVNPFRSIALARVLRKRILLSKPDVIHFLVEPYAFALGFIPRWFLGKDISTFITIHGTYAYIPHLITNPFKRALSKLLTNRMHARVDRVITVSKYTKEFLLEHVDPALKDRLAERTSVIGNGVSAISPLRIRAKRDPARILFVGGVKERKGVLEAVELIQKYRSTYGSRIEFHIVGSLTDEPHYVAKVQDRIHELGLEACVTLLGTISETELAAEYEAADLFLMLSLGGGKEFEGFGLVYLEANAYSVPVIGAYGTGAEDAIDQGNSGYLVHATDEAEGAKALDAILNDHERFSRGAHAWAETHLWKYVVTKYVEVYRSTKV